MAKRNIISATQISDSTGPKVLSGRVKTIVIKNLNSPQPMWVGFNTDANSNVQINAGDGLVLSLDDGTYFDGNTVYTAFAQPNAGNYGFMITVRETDEDC